MPSKRCTGCDLDKSLSEFSRKGGTSDGRNTQCRTCRSAYMRRYYTEKFGRRRPAVPEGFKFCAKCRTVKPRDEFGANAGRADGLQTYCRPCWRRYDTYARKPSAAKAKAIAWRVNDHRRHPQKHRARMYVMLAVFFGDLKKGPCEVCGAKRVQAHHDDYSTPLRVRWLCNPHHDALHPHEQKGYHRPR